MTGAARPMPMRRLLDVLYDGAAVLAACCMVALLATVVLSIAGRQFDFHVRGTDAYAGYLMAAAGFLALAHTLNTAGISPLTQLARQVAASPTHIWRSLRRARKGQADAEMQAERNRMAQMWASFSSYLATVAERYDRAYAIAFVTRQQHLAEEAANAQRRAEEEAQRAAEAGEHS